MIQHHTFCVSYILLKEYSRPLPPHAVRLINLGAFALLSERSLHLVMARVPEADRRLIIELSQKGHSQRAIGALVNRPLKTVNRIVQAFRYEGRIHDAPRGAPPRATTEDDDRCIIAAVVEDPFLSAREIREELQLDVSDVTVRRRLRSAGLHSAMAAQKPLLSHSNKEARLRFAMGHVSWTADDWGRVVFSTNPPSPRGKTNVCVCGDPAAHGKACLVC